MKYSLHRDYFLWGVVLLCCFLFIHATTSKTTKKGSNNFPAGNKNGFSINHNSNPRTPTKNTNTAARSSASSVTVNTLPRTPAKYTHMEVPPKHTAGQVYNHPLSHDEALRQIHYPETGGYFHVYDIHAQRHHSSECAPFYEEHNASQSSIPSMMKKYKMWSGDWMNQERLKRNPLAANDTLFGFKHAMDKIWEHQHPKDCKNVQFLISTEQNGGFGSELHVLISGLGIAMDMNRVYLHNPWLCGTKEWEIDIPFCKAKGDTKVNSDRNSLGLDCYYEPWSSCTIFDALGDNALEILLEVKRAKYNSLTWKSPKYPNVFRLSSTDPQHMYSDDMFLDRVMKHYQKDKVVMLHDGYRLAQAYVPRALRPVVYCSPVYPQFHYYWWRAISIAYAVRPNSKTIAWIQSHRNTSFEQAVARSRETITHTGSQSKNVVAVYVRRGDKSREMRISPIQEYIDGMRLLWSLNYLNTPAMSTNSSVASRVMFLASESSQVIEEITEWVENKNQHHHNNHSHHGLEKYDMYYTTVFDRKGLYAEKNAQERDAGGKFVTNPDEYLSMLLNIYHLLQADAWVCQIGSNFCRVIDELRATVAGKASGPYVDLSEEKCIQPPCIYGGFMDMDWR